MSSTIQDTKLQIPPSVADRLLERLATDDVFRELFARDRHAALIDVGLDSEKVNGAPLACMVVETLAGKAEIAAAREALKAHLTWGGNHTSPHMLEAGAMQAVLREG
ncbi:putative modified peptide [Kribbella antibiotica]|uniref:Putative modified peptide n=1 Tax=Kribbella antibiotica TaxID=190195 RepID=A0A4R4YQ52_9ACTN|nr:NHLP-related RiPP peptide [Kribbella antibiotica]TDD47271.1 putative modified peptide [Kribbella antibiotica]